MKKLIAASLVALFAVAGSPVQAQEGEPVLIPLVKEALILNGLKLSDVKYSAIYEDGKTKPVPSLPEEAKLREWVKSSVTQLGFKFSGSSADPMVTIETECGWNNCVTRAVVAREAFIKRISGKKESYVRLPKVFVAEFKGEKRFENDEARASAAFESLREVVLSFSKAAAEANEE